MWSNSQNSRNGFLLPTSDRLASSALNLCAAAAAVVGRVRWKNYHGRSTLARAWIPNRSIVGRSLVKLANNIRNQGQALLWPRRLRAAARLLEPCAPRVREFPISTAGGTWFRKPRSVRAVVGTLGLFSVLPGFLRRSGTAFGPNFGLVLSAEGNPVGSTAIFPAT